MSTQQELLGTLKEMEVVLSDTSVSLLQKATKVRKLSYQIIGALTDPKKVSDEISRSGSSSKCDTSLWMISHFMNDLPQMYVEDYQTYSDETPDLTQLKSNEVSENKLFSQAFTFWIVSHFVNLLSHQSCQRYHEKTIKMLCSLLQLLKAKDPHAFVQLVSEFIMGLSDLVDLCEVFEMEGVSQLKRFQMDSDSIGKMAKCQSGNDSNFSNPKPITINSVESLELLQTNLTALLGHLIPDICQFAHSKVQLLWGVLGYQLEFGEVQLKLVSLDVSSKLLQSSGFPLMANFDYYLNCLGALVDLLCSGFDDLPGDYESLERNLATCFSLVFVESRTCFTTHTLTSYQLEDTLGHITKAVLAHGLQKLQTHNLRRAICNTVAAICSKLPANSVKQSHTELTSALVKDIGYAQDQKYMTKYLMQSVAMDFSTKPGKALMNIATSVTITDSDTSSADEAPGKRRKLSLGKKEHGDGDRAEPVIAQKSGTLKLICAKLDELCNQIIDEGIDKENIRLSLKGIQLCMEVIVSCAAESWTQSNGTQHVTTSTRTPSKQPKDVSILSQWLLPYYVEKVCKAWKTVLMKCVLDKTLLGVVPQCYKAIVQTVGSLVYLQDFTQFPSKISSCFVWILSVSWISNDVTWMDLKPQDYKDVAQIGRVLEEKIDEETVGESIHILSLFPKEISPKWRTHVMKLALGSTSSPISNAAILSFPILLYHLGPNANHLVYDLIHDRIQTEQVQKSLATIAGPLACVVSRKAVLQRSKNASQDLCYKTLVLKCVSCDDLAVEEDHTSPATRPKFVDPTMFSPFLHLLSTTDNAVKLSLIQSFTCMFGHIGVRSNNAVTVNMLNACLDLIEDPNYQIRIAFSKTVQHLVGENSSENASKTDHLIVSKLKSASNNALTNSSHRLQETIVMTIGQLGRVAEGELLLVVISSLLQCLLSTEPLVAAVAHEQIQQVAKHKKKRVQILFTQFRQRICTFLVDALHEAQTIGSSKDTLSILTEVANVFDYPNVKSFIQGIVGKYMLPPLVTKASSAGSCIIKTMAQQVETSRKMLLINNIRYIFCYVVRTCNEADLNKALTYLKEETNFELASLLKLNFQKNLNELCLFLSTNYNKLFNGLKMLASSGDADKGGRTITSTDEMASFLQPQFLGILGYFDSHLLNSNIPQEEKLLALESLPHIIRMMGTKRITAVRMKVMTTLRLGLKFKNKGFAEINYKAWNVFVRSIEMSALGPMLSQIIVTLLPLLNQIPAKVSELYNYLIVENKKQLQTYFSELSFLPDIPELADINAVLRKHNENLASTDLKVQISQILKGVSHDSIDVRQLALPKLKQLLHNNQAAIHKLVIGSETADTLISQLVTVLLDGCRDSDPAIRNMFGECLGELGAIDPGRLELKTNNPKEETAKFQASVDDVNFAFDLINELCRAFLAAEDTRTQDCISLAIQEVLKAYEVKDTGGNKPGEKLWNRFPEHIKEILAPLLNSRYMLNFSFDAKSVQHPIYRTKKGNQFKEWVSTWTQYLASRVQAVKAGAVFTHCGLAMKHDLHTALYLLPHIVVQVLLSGKEQSKDGEQICGEIMAVLNHVKKPETRQGSASDFRHMSAQTVFSVLDHLTKWKRHRLQYLANTTPQGTKEEQYAKDESYQRIKKFLEKIPQDILAEASYNCRAYTRSLMHFEQFIKLNKQNIQEHLDFMQKLYVAMDEPDGVAGVMAIREEAPSLAEQILAHESIGQFQDACACYGRAIQLEPDNIGHHRGLLQCFMNLGQLNTALVHADGVLHNDPLWQSSINAYRVEAAWKLGDWGKLENFIKMEEKTNNNWGIGLGRILLAAKYRKEDEFLEEIRTLRSEQMGPLSAASMESGSYQRGYEFIVRLHMLNEIEQGIKSVLHLPVSSQDSGEIPIGRQKLLAFWEARLQLAQSSFRVQEPLLNLHRVILGLASDIHLAENDSEQDIGQLWLRSAKVARKACHLQTAYSSLLNASTFQLSDFCVEKAKWLWLKGDYDQAQTCLEKGVGQHFSESSKLKLSNSEEDKKKRLAYAKAKLLFACYNEETAMLESNAIFKQYKEVVEVCPDWEDGYFCLAKYYDKVMTSLADTEKAEKLGDFLVLILHNFGNSLLYGSQYIYQSMPRMLSIWLDYGSVLSKMEKDWGKTRPTDSTPAVIVIRRDNLKKMNKIISSMRDKLAPYQFLTAFPQLISRICHAHDEVFLQLQEIMAQLMAVFPQQAMWMLMAVSKSSYKMRAKRCQQILTRAKSLKPELNKFIQDANKLTDRLLELCDKKVESNVLTMSIMHDFRGLKRLLDDKTFSPILLPLQSSMTVTLPTSPEQHVNHDPFPGQQIFIQGFEDPVEVLNSLQKPKKVTIRGSDGNLYTMLCKPKDDLRKDCRLMEFNGIVNKFLRKDPEARRRQLHLRTYFVVPLNEECGLLEWVPNTHGFRHILLKMYKEKGLYTSGRELKACHLPPQAPLKQKLEVFKNKLLPWHPPVFSEWFLTTFPDPTSWYTARLNYAHTSAVISIVGYILGLGDRHGENILYDSTTGDTVHVDFNCLFNKGETFEFPEVVPFRLTHNMVDAMGPMGHEGIFRRACEVTLRVMKNQTDPLMSVLKTFIYDPLVEWSKPVRGRSNPAESGEITNDKALTHVQNIESRLKGILKKEKKVRGLPLSVEGHVNYLIQEATDENKLCQMYIGWAAYL